jgi:hypothetical protein
MGCLVINGIQRNCDFSVAGIKSSIWIGNDEDWIFKYDATGEVTGYTSGSTGATFYEYQQELESASLVETLQAGAVTRFISQAVVFSLAGMTQAKIESLNTLALTKVVVILQKNDGNWYVVGDKGSGLKASAEEINSGMKDADSAIATVTLTGSNKGYAPTVSATVLANLGIA